MNKVKSVLNKYAPILLGKYLNFIHSLNSKIATRQVLNIFCTPRGGQIRPHHKKYLDSINSQKLQFGSLTIQTYYIDNNARDTILMAHGWESNSARWKRTINYLKDTKVNVVLLDAPAHGDTESRHFNAVLYAKMINVVVQYYKPNIIMGHSIGGFACALYLKTFDPTFINNFIVLASPNTMQSILDSYQNLIGMSSKLKTSLYELIEHKFNKPVSYFKVSNFIHGLPIKGMIIHDEFDNINSFDGALEIKEAWGKNCKLIKSNGMGHGLQDELVYSNIKEYIESIIINN